MREHIKTAALLLISVSLAGSLKDLLGQCVPGNLLRLIFNQEGPKDEKS